MIEKFKMKMLPGGYVEITWQGIVVAKGRPWINDPELEGYSALVQHLWGREEYYDHILLIEGDIIDS